MTIAMAASFLLVHAIAFLVIMRFFKRLRGPDSDQFREWLKDHPEKVAEILNNEDQYGG